MSLLNKLTQVAKSKQGQEFLQKAKTFANDPKTRAKIDEAREKLTDQVNTAKEKMAEKKHKEEAEHKGSSAASAAAAAARGRPRPAPRRRAPPAEDAPAPVGETPAPPADPGYGDDGPKAA